MIDFLFYEVLVPMFNEFLAQKIWLVNNQQELLVFTTFTLFINILFQVFRIKEVRVASVDNLINELNVGLKLLTYKSRSAFSMTRQSCLQTWTFFSKGVIANVTELLSTVAKSRLHSKNATFSWRSISSLVCSLFHSGLRGIFKIARTEISFKIARTENSPNRS